MGSTIKDEQWTQGTLMVDISWSVASLLCCHRQIITLMHHHISHLPAWSLFIVVLVINILCKNLLCLLYINQQSWSEARPIEALIKLISTSHQTCFISEVSTSGQKYGPQFGRDTSNAYLIKISLILNQLDRDGMELGCLCGTSGL